MHDPQLAAELLHFTQVQIFRNGNAGNRSAFLDNHSDSPFQRIQSALRLPWLPMEQHRAGIRLLHSCRNGTDCGFSGAVFSNQAPNLSGVDIEGNVPQRNGAGKSLPNVFHFQNGWFHTLTS